MVMYYFRSTQVPNEIFDQRLPFLNQAQLKVLLVVIRQTIGWINPKTKQRKRKDWISHTFFQRKTGLTSKSISLAISELVKEEVIVAMDYYEKKLKSPSDRRGKKRIYYAYAPYYYAQKQKTLVDILAEVFTFQPNTKQTLTKQKQTKEPSLNPKQVQMANRRLSDKERYQEILRGNNAP